MISFCTTLQLLKDLVERRRNVKKWMKTASGLKIQQLDIQQQALKLTANRFLLLFRLLICCPHLDYISLVLEFIYIYIYGWVLQYVWMLGVFKLEILCKATGRAYNTASKKNMFSLADIVLANCSYLI